MARGTEEKDGDDRAQDGNFAGGGELKEGLVNQ